MVNALGNAVALLIATFIAGTTAGAFAGKSFRDQTQYALTFIWRLAIVCLLAIIILKL